MVQLRLLRFLVSSAENEAPVHRLQSGRVPLCVVNSSEVRFFLSGLSEIFLSLNEQKFIFFFLSIFFSVRRGCILSMEESKRGLEIVEERLNRVEHIVAQMKNEQHAKHLEIMDTLQSIRNMHEQEKLRRMEHLAAMKQVESVRNTVGLSENAKEPTKNTEEPAKNTEEPTKVKDPETKKKTDFLVNIWNAADGDNQKFLAFLHTIPMRGFEVDDVHEVMKIEAIDAACKSYIWYCLMFVELHGDSSVAVVKECIDGMHPDIRSLLINSNREGAYRHCKDALVRSTGKEFDPRHDRFVASAKPILDFLTSSAGPGFVVCISRNPLEDGEEPGTGSKREREDGEVQEQQQQDSNNNKAQQEAESETLSKRQRKEDDE